MRWTYFEEPFDFLLTRFHGEPVITRSAASRRPEPCSSTARRTSATPTTGKLRLILVTQYKLIMQMFTTAAQLLDLTDSETPLGQMQHRSSSGEDQCD